MNIPFLGIGRLLLLMVIGIIFVKSVTSKIKVKIPIIALVFFFLIIASFLLSGIINISPIAFNELFEFAVGGTFLFLSPFFINRDLDRVVGKTLNYFVLFTFLLSSYNLIRVIVGIETITRLRPPLANPIFWGVTLGVSTVILANKIVKEKVFSRKIILAIVAASLLVSLLLTNSRGPAIATFFALLFLPVLYNKNFLKTFLYISGAIIILFIIFFGAVNMFPDTFERLTPDLAYHLTDRNIQTRINMLKSAFGIVRETPLFGAGIGNYYKITGYIYPHNIFLDIVVSAGLVGLSFFVAFWLYLLNYLKRKWDWVKENQGDNERFLLGSSTSIIIIILLAAQFSGHLNSFNLLWFFAGAVFCLPRSDLRKPMGCEKK